jgi:Mlc titration factor MtfA (ptsG expression regulator)
MFAWLRRRRRKKLLSKPFPGAWLETIESLPFYSRLDAEESENLRGIVRILAAEKYWTGCGGLELTDEIVVSIAAQAGLLLLHLPHDYFSGTDEILVYPREFFDPRDRSDMHGIMHAGEELSGQAHVRGPIVLAWNEAKGGIARGVDGRNVVLHEFAHRLDMADGYADGIPLVRAVEAWAELMDSEREELKRAASAGRKTLLDPYGKDDPAEFFAVATECFFEKGGYLKRDRPELYEALSEFYGQDPAGRGS